MPLELPPTFAISKVAIPLPDASTFTATMRTERSAGPLTCGFTGVTGFEEVSTVAGFVVTGCASSTNVPALMTTVAVPCACFELVALAPPTAGVGMKIIERGTASGPEPERTGVIDIALSVGTVIAAPQGRLFAVPPADATSKWNPLLH